MSITKNIQKTAVLLLAVAMMFSSFAPVTQAQTVSAPSHNIDTIDEFIAYLYQLIAQLEQVKAQQAARSYNYNYNYGYSQSTYYPSGQVQGVTYGNYDVDVETLSVGNTDDDETTLYGDVDLNGAPYATVWFQYGEDGDLDERTRAVKIDRYRSDMFSSRITDLDEDERYSYRAVAEDPSGRRTYGDEKWFQLDNYRSSSRDDDEPDVDTDEAEDVEEDEAELHGEVDMNDFRNGLVFFVYGEDEDEVEDVEDEDEYRDIDENGDDLQKVIVDSDLDGDRNYWRRVVGLDDNTDHYFRICVEYEDEDDDETLECGDVEHFETD